MKKSSKNPSFFPDDIISSIAKRNIKNFLNYKRWKNSTINDENAGKTTKENKEKNGKNGFFEQKNLEIKKIHASSCEKIMIKTEKKVNLKHIYRKMVNNKHVFTQSLSDLQQILHKNSFSKTFSGDFLKNNKENRTNTKEINGFCKKKMEKKNKEMTKLGEIVTKVKNFKMNFSEKNMEPINKLLESVKSLNKYAENRNLQIKKKKFLVDSAKNNEKNTVFKGNLMKNNSKSFDSARITIRPEKNEKIEKMEKIEKIPKKFQ